ncbi:MAG TPA: CusA/CzcA family heavy metal efflux RND transporter [Polyangiales bacterium]|nr:CusA/CzcA family heavy metal efflux RND transporter [Polyangiales bacterium]
MRALLEFCLRYRVFAFAFALLVCAVGVHSALELPIDAVPDITNVQVQVLTKAPALGPIDVERTVTFPVESALNGLPGVETLRSVSRYGLSAVTIVFEDGTDVLRARQLVFERLSQVRDALPPTAEPELSPLSTGLGEILLFEVRARALCPKDAPPTPGCHTAMELRSLLDWFIAFELRTVPGVVEVNSWGGELKTYEVEVLPERLRALQLSLNDLFSALERDNATAGGGYLERAGEQLVVRGEGRLQNLDEIGDVLIETRGDGVPVRVRDVARVRLAPFLRQGAVTRDARGEIVTGTVLMLAGANGRQVVERVRAKLQEIVPALPEGVSIDVFYDRAELVSRTIRTVATNLAEGALFVIGVLFLLLGSLRGGLIVAAAIPFSLAAAFTGMKYLGLSGNLMSLGAIDFGIVVDASIIVVESAVVQLAAAAAARGRERPLSYAEAAQVILGSTLDVRKAAFFGEAVIVIVYIPILALTGIEGRMFRPMAISVLFALLGAFFASLTFVPVLAATALRQQTEQREPVIIRALRRWYAPLLERALARPRALLATCLPLTAAAVLVGVRLGAEFVPRLNEGSIAIELRRLPSVALGEAIDGATRLERLLREFPEVKTEISKLGRAEIAIDPMGLEQADILIHLQPIDQWASGRTKQELIAAMQSRIADELPGINCAFSQPIELRMAELVSGARADLAITIFGDDLATLQRLSAAVQAELRKVRGAADVRGEPLAGMPSLEVRVDRAAASRYGVSVRDAFDAIEALGGRQVGEVYEGERRYRLQVRLPAAVRDDIDQLRALPVGGPNGPLVALGQIATFSTGDSPASVSRQDARRRTNVDANVRGRDLLSFVNEARARIVERVKLPPGYLIRWGGQFEHLSAAAGRLSLVVPLALGLIFVLLYLAFGSSKPALLIYLNVPFAAVGGVFALALRGMPLSISASIGFIALFGVSVLNGVVLLTTISKLRASGRSPLEAAREGARARLRAVIMTATVATLGFIPMALSTSAGAEVQRPLATVVIGGLLSATILTLFVLPAAYALAYRKTG